MHCSNRSFSLSLSLYRHVLRVRAATPGWRMLCWQSASTSSASSALRRATTHARGSAPNATRPSGPTTSIASTSAKSHAAKLVRKRVSKMSWSRDTAWGKGSARHSRAPSSNYVLPLHSDVQEIVGEETVDDFSFVWAAVMLWSFFCCCCCIILTITEASLIQCPLINFLFLMLVQTEACLCSLIWKQPIKPVIRETAVLWMLVCMYTVNAIFFSFLSACFCSVLPWNKLTWCCIIAVLLVIKITWKLFCFFFVFLLLKPCEVLAFDPAALKYKSQCANLCLSPLSRASLCSSSPKPQTCLHAGNGR